MATAKIIKNRKIQLLECQIIDNNVLNNSYTVKFENGEIKNLPKDRISNLNKIDEGILDRIKILGKRLIDQVIKIGQYVFTKFDNFILPAISPINSAIATKNNKSVNVYLNKDTIDAAKELKINITNPSIDEIDDKKVINDYIKYLNDFWHNVITIQKETKGSVKESYNLIKESYKTVYEKANGIYNFNNMLNEAKLSSTLEGVPDASYDEIMDMLLDRLQDRYEMGDSNNNNETASLRPLLIWGAPGIGKTSIVKDLISQLNSQKDNNDKKVFNFSCLEITASSILPDGFTLPNFVNDNKRNDLVAADVPKTWLPVYKVADMDDPNKEEKDRLGNETANLGDGGFIFIDEISRIMTQTMYVIMTLIQGRKINDLQLGSKWVIVAAGNRREDMGDNADDFKWEQAWGGRFDQVNYLPSYEKWRTWAVKAGVDKLILSFLDGHKELWYDESQAAETEHLAANPRGWTDFSNEIHKTQRMLKNKDSKFNAFRKTRPDRFSYQNTTGLSNVDLVKMAARTVGSRATDNFASYLEFDSIFSVEDAINTWKTGNSSIVNDKLPFDVFSGNISRITEKILDCYPLYRSEINKPISNEELPFESITPKELKNINDYLFTLCEKSKIINTLPMIRHIIVNRLMEGGFDILAESDKDESPYVDAMEILTNDAILSNQRMIDAENNKKPSRKKTNEDENFDYNKNLVLNDDIENDDDICNIDVDNAFKPISLNNENIQIILNCLKGSDEQKEKILLDLTTFLITEYAEEKSLNELTPDEFYNLCHFLMYIFIKGNMEINTNNMGEQIFANLYNVFKTENINLFDFLNLKKESDFITDLENYQGPYKKGLDELLKF